MLREVMRVSDAVFGQPASTGALSLLYAATDASVGGGEYFGPDHLAGFRGHPTRIAPARGAKGEDLAARLWALSEQLTGVTYPFGT